MSVCLLDELMVRLPTARHLPTLSNHPPPVLVCSRLPAISKITIPHLPNLTWMHPSCTAFRLICLFEVTAKVCLRSSCLTWFSRARWGVKLKCRKPDNRKDNSVFLFYSTFFSNKKKKKMFFLLGCADNILENKLHRHTAYCAVIAMNALLFMNALEADKRFSRKYPFKMSWTYPRSSDGL